MLSLTPDPGINKSLYWAPAKEERRQRLMPFLWNVIAEEGQLFGNRAYNNKVDVSNPYALSYPGYSELLTGNVDFTIYGNDKKLNRNNDNILEVLNTTKAYSGKVAAFTSWDVFPFILNDKAAGFPINSGLQKIEGKDLSPAEKLINHLQADVLDEAPTRDDALTYIACREYVVRNKPSIVFLSFSGTDDAGHNKRYDRYLQEAANADRMIGELWRMLQTIPDYKEQTTFLITTDHGRGDQKKNWSEHGFFISGSAATWYALLGSSVVPTGEVKTKDQQYTKELNALAMGLLMRK